MPPPRTAADPRTPPPKERSRKTRPRDRRTARTRRSGTRTPPCRPRASRAAARRDQGPSPPTRAGRRAAGPDTPPGPPARPGGPRAGRPPVPRGPRRATAGASPRTPPGPPGAHRRGGRCRRSGDAARWPGRCRRTSSAASHRPSSGSPHPRPCGSARCRAQSRVRASAPRQRAPATHARRRAQTRSPPGRPRRTRAWTLAAPRTTAANTDATRPGKRDRAPASGQPRSRSRRSAGAGRWPAASSSGSLEHKRRVRQQPHLGAGRKASATRLVVRLGGVQLEVPRRPEAPRGQEERAVLAARVEDEQEGVVLDLLAARPALHDLGTVEEYADHALVGLPVALRHPAAIGSQPVHVRQSRALQLGAGQVTVAPEYRMLTPHPDQPARELMQRAGLLGIAPCVPGDVVVLAPRIVVAVLGAPPLVAAQEHRRTLGEQQRGEEVALLARTQRQDVGVVGGALHAAVP